jgi:hypothetical protein
MAKIDSNVVARRSRSRRERRSTGVPSPKTQPQRCSGRAPSFSVLSLLPMSCWPSPPLPPHYSYYLCAAWPQGNCNDTSIYLFICLLLSRRQSNGPSRRGGGAAAALTLGSSLLPASHSDPGLVNGPTS